MAELTPGPAWNVTVVPRFRPVGEDPVGRGPVGARGYQPRLLWYKFGKSSGSAMGSIDQSGITWRGQYGSLLPLQVPLSYWRCVFLAALCRYAGPYASQNKPKQYALVPHYVWSIYYVPNWCAAGRVPPSNLVPVLKKITSSIPRNHTN